MDLSPAAGSAPSGAQPDMPQERLGALEGGADSRKPPARLGQLIIFLIQLF